MIKELNMTNPTELHVIFGTGPLGKWTARELVKLGKPVRMVNRSGKASGLPAGVEVVAGDAYEVAKNVAVTQGATTVYQCAQPHYYEWAEKFPPLQAAILEAVAANGAKLVVGDNLYMYGAPHGQPLREDSPVAPNTKKGRVRAAMAAQILEAHAKGKVRAAIGRASDFFGPDDTALTGYAIQPAVKGKSINLMGRDDQPHAFTYIADFGKALATLGTRDEALGQIWFAPTNPALTQKAFVKLLEAELKQPVKAMVGGPLMMRFIGLFNREVNEVVEMMFEWLEPYVVESGKIEKAFGLRPTPLPQAIRETVAWLRTLPA
jgi:nucleoside-diphosphate-sugar epimerase